MEQILLKQQSTIEEQISILIAQKKCQQYLNCSRYECK
ncbi:hypothetical protein P23_0710 [Acinetobacter calcoaceticus]|nr:hypothetical protein P23_0710 [Acinetobacter calcoaceticus]